MNRLRRAAILLVSLMLACTAHGQGAPQQQDTALRLVASEWPPYVDASISRDGVAPQLVMAALRRAGFRVQLFIDYWPKSLDATAAGDFDGILSLWYTDERAKSIAFSEAFITNNLQFMKRAADEIELSSREDFVGLRVGVVEDYAYSEKQYDTTDIEIVSGGSVGDNIEKLLAGEVDLVLGDSLVLRHQADLRRASKRLEVLPLVLESRGLHFGVSLKRPDHAEIIAAFNDSIAAMRADGTYASLLANYRINNQ